MACDSKQNKGSLIPKNLADMIKQILSKIEGSPSDSDVMIYRGEIARHGYEKVSDLCERQTGRKNVLLMLETPGGDADSAFRIARCLGSRYKKFTVIVPGWCKSAGTILCLGANELVISDRGELGPLDVQIRKTDELGELGSGLDLMKTFGYLQNNAYEAFRSFMVDIRMGGQMSTKIAAEMATALSVGLYGKIFAQIDPVKVGEVQRALSIASAYGELLDEKSKNLKDGALAKLVAGYPTHGFVIDRKEAKQLFENVRKPSPEEDCLCRFLMKTTNPTIDYFHPKDEEESTHHDQDEKHTPQDAVSSYASEGNGVGDAGAQDAHG